MKDTKEWAQQIREIKINELKKMIKDDQKIHDSIVADNNFAIMLKTEYYLERLNRLKSKLKIISS